jgi:hypothetical protein
MKGCFRHPGKWAVFVKKICMGIKVIIKPESMALLWKCLWKAFLKKARNRFLSMMAIAGFAVYG